MHCTRNDNVKHVKTTDMYEWHVNNSLVKLGWADGWRDGDGGGDGDGDGDGWGRAGSLAGG